MGQRRWREAAAALREEHAGALMCTSTSMARERADSDIFGGGGDAAAVEYDVQALRALLHHLQLQASADGARARRAEAALLPLLARCEGAARAALCAGQRCPLDLVDMVEAEGRGTAPPPPPQPPLPAAALVAFDVPAVPPHAPRAIRAMLDKALVHQAAGEFAAALTAIAAAAAAWHAPAELSAVPLALAEASVHQAAGDAAGALAALCRALRQCTPPPAPPPPQQQQQPTAAAAAVPAAALGAKKPGAGPAAAPARAAAGLAKGAGRSNAKSAAAAAAAAAASAAAAAAAASAAAAAAAKAAQLQAAPQPIWDRAGSAAVCCSALGAQWFYRGRAAAALRCFALSATLASLAAESVTARDQEAAPSAHAPPPPDEDAPAAAAAAAEVCAEAAAALASAAACLLSLGRVAAAHECLTVAKRALATELGCDHPRTRAAHASLAAVQGQRWGAGGKGGGGEGVPRGALGVRWVVGGARRGDGVLSGGFRFAGVLPPGRAEVAAAKGNRGKRKGKQKG
ncbi:hypothetical protein JKP88DRAFT_244392 [Tribonema minus]|uniref:Uncharacterized protein n=1 Tax=Tribonema minus TaxID=303371 RepID=A0A835Z1M9_9STRA|nr:hypothetical protein JKP88DRAFT_244392 [Tribonema minus]